MDAEIVKKIATALAMCLSREKAHVTPDGHFIIDLNVNDVAQLNEALQSAKALCEDVKFSS